MTFTALVLDQTDDAVTAELRQLDESALPDGDVTVAVEWSSLNYKDGMVLQGIGRLVKTYPHVPGVDLAGTVVESASERFEPGDRVVLTGWRVGELWWGGYATRARVRAEWLVPLPEGLTTRQAMAVGTAGFTAMQALLALGDDGLDPGDGPLLVTGASGGVGSSAVLWGGALGHEIWASTGRTEHADELEALGASSVIDRAELERPTRPLLSERWAGCVDAVGGDTLARVLAELRYGRAVAACGNAGGIQLDTTVIPFLLRGVRVLGIDSVQCPTPVRERVWSRIAAVVDPERLEAMTGEVSLADLPGLAPEILAGRVKGRTVVRCDA